MRSQKIILNDKEFEIKELKISEFLKIKDEIMKNLGENKKIEDLFNEGIEKYLPLVIENITKEDILEAYPSELEQVVETFKDVNFSGLKKIIGFIGMDSIKSFLKSTITSYLGSELTQDV